jgi:heme/copper-type cytochrome/quinol oxidase subunit 3
MQRDVVEKRELTREEEIALKNRRFGLFLFQLSWILVFVCLIFVNWQLRYQYESWPPTGVPKLGLGLPSLATVMLLVSAFLARRGTRAIAADNHVEFTSSWRWVLGLGAAFAVMMAFEWLNAPMGTQYGTLFRVMTAFHAIHALAIGAFMWRVLRHSERYNSQDYWPVEAGAKLWYFVTVAWLMFYVVLYWI